MKNKKMVIIDGNSLINRAYYALPPLMTKEGLYTNAVYGFNNMLNKIIEENNPEYIVVAFDKKAPTFRHKEYTEYKAGRKKMPLELAQQLPLLKELLDAMNIEAIELDGFEADDLIGTIVKKTEEAEMKTIVITGDKDALQLASDSSQIVITKKGISEFEVYDKNFFIKKYGITPDQFIDLKGLMGDSSDNIPGIPGIGEKTGLKLIKEFGSVNNVVNRVSEIKSERIRQKIIDHTQSAIMSRRLAEINTHVPIDVQFEKYSFQEPDNDKLIKIYNRLEFYSLIPKLKKTGQSKSSFKTVYDDKDSILVNDKKTLDKMINSLKEGQEIVIKVFSDENHIKKPAVMGIGLLSDHRYFYIPLGKEDIQNNLKDSLNKLNLNISGHDIKRDIYALLHLGIRNFKIEFDTAIAQYLIQPERSNYELSTLALEYLNVDLLSEKEFLNQNSQIEFWADINKKYEEYGFKWCKITKALIDILKDRIEVENLMNLYRTIELPLIEALAEMEYNGFRIDEKELTRIGDRLKKEIEEISQRIYELAGEQFNINSTKQLGPILFDKLKLPTIKKTKTGYSTGIDVLEKLKNSHDIIPLIIEYRTLAKLKSTYIEGLIPLINKETNRIHAHFNQTVTTTGRISCTEPNLQNIPIKQEAGRLLRKAFIPERDYILMGADYSQIELRVLAHISEDASLTEAFMNNEDIHTMTASKVFNISPEEVTSLQRARAKAVNFGVIYGMSDYGLSENLNIPRKEAAQYIQEYFKKYSTVKTYMDEMIESCKKNGYVHTIMNRKRHVPEITSKNFNIRSFGERLAMNTPIQGSAADIIKIAMRDVYKALKENTKSRLILQVHDELIIEVHNEEVEKVKELLMSKMENAVALKVPLKVDLNVGENWYRLK